jgi:steroid 5-alpha reductase family enzyme
MVVVWAAIALLTISTIAWLYSIVARDASVVDALWGVSQIVIAGVALTAGETVTARSWLTALLVTTWGVRLAAYLTVRARGRGEDWRHQRARARQRHFVWRSLPEVFWFQLVGGALVVGLPLFAVVAPSQPPLGWLDLVAVLIWAVGFTLEVVADLQLARFRRDRCTGERLLQAGLWGYSRHPNYFGETVLWIGVALIGVAAGAWWALLSPVMVLVVILRVSGVAVMDQHLSTTRSEKFAELTRTTSAFVPLPRRSAGLRR